MSAAGRMVVHTTCNLKSFSGKKKLIVEVIRPHKAHDGINSIASSSNLILSLV